MLVHWHLLTFLPRTVLQAHGPGGELSKREERMLREGGGGSSKYVHGGGYGSRSDGEERQDDEDDEEEIYGEAQSLYHRKDAGLGTVGGSVGDRQAPGGPPLKKPHNLHNAATPSIGAFFKKGPTSSQRESSQGGGISGASGESSASQGAPAPLSVSQDMSKRGGIPSWATPVAREDAMEARIEEKKAAREDEREVRDVDSSLAVAAPSSSDTFQIPTGHRVDPSSAEIAPEDATPGAHDLESKLILLGEMGFTDREACTRSLAAAEGNVERALEVMLGGGGEIGRASQGAGLGHKVQLQRGSGSPGGGRGRGRGKGPVGQKTMDSFFGRGGHK